MRSQNDDQGSSFSLEVSNSVKLNLVGLIDAALVLTLFFIVIYFLPQTILGNLQDLARPEVYILLAFVTYRLVALFLTTGTLGMRLCRVQLLNDNCQALSVKEKICAAFFVLINDVGYYV